MKGVPAALAAPAAFAAPGRPAAIGLGTWLTFDVGRNSERVQQRTQILQAFLAGAGNLVDSSPMYGTSEAVIGHALRSLGPQSGLYSATKVWKMGAAAGRRSLAESLRLWGLPRFDLVQVHNLLDWQAHLPVLSELREEGLIGDLGVTTSHGRRHASLLRLIRQEPRIDSVQFTYNLADRAAETALLPAAAERGLFVVINRPFRGGRLFEHVAGKPLPKWAPDIGCDNWAQFFLKFIISHPAVGCAIPATSQLAHLQENMGALRAPLPNARQRRAMAACFDSL